MVWHKLVRNMGTETQGIQIIRPIALEDHATFYECALAAKEGITHLPKNSSLLQKKIFDSLESFNKNVKTPDYELYLFVLEDLKSNQILGTASIIAQIGTASPLYSFKLMHTKLIAPSIRREVKHQILQRVNRNEGVSEIAGLFLFPNYQGRSLGKLLALSRFLFIANFPERFCKTILASLRGYLDENGLSPFWEKVMRPFFKMDYPTSNLLRAVDEQFIGDLLPEYPIYLDFFSQEVMKVIGRPHRDSVPALQMLQYEGFIFADEIDTFDAGPDLYASLHAIRSITESREASISQIVDEMNREPHFIISNVSLQFRACFGAIQIEDNGQVMLTKEVASALKVNLGEKIRYLQCLKCRRE